MESKFCVNSVQSWRKWLTFSTFSLQMKQSAPCVLESQGTPPLKPKFPMISLVYVGSLQGLGSRQQETKTDREVRLVSMLGQHACLDDLAISSAIHRSPSPEF